MPASTYVKSHKNSSGQGRRIPKCICWVFQMLLTLQSLA